MDTFHDVVLLSTFVLEPAQAKRTFHFFLSSITPLHYHDTDNEENVEENEACNYERYQRWNSNLLVYDEILSNLHFCCFIFTSIFVNQSVNQFRDISKRNIVADLNLHFSFVSNDNDETY